MAVLLSLGLLAVRLAEVAWSSWSALGATGPARVDDAVAALTATAGLALTAWLVAAVALSVAAAATGNRSAAGRTVGRLTRRIAPMVLRNAVAAALGVVVATSPAVAHAADESVPRPVPVAQQSDGRLALSPAWLTTSAGPTQARTAPRPGSARRAAGVDASSAVTPVGTAASTSSTAARTDPSVAGDLRPGWIPIRPADARGAHTSRPTAPVAAAPRRAPLTESGDVVVRQGDTLWSIASRHLGPGATDAEIALDWPHWFTANRTVIGPDPDRLRTGERLRPPSAHTRGAVR